MIQLETASIMIHRPFVLGLEVSETIYYYYFEH